MNFETMKKELTTIIKGTNLDNPNLLKLMNNIIALSNPKIRVYYNFSIKSFVNLLENTNLTEFDGLLKMLDMKKQYSIETYEGLEDFLDYLSEEGDMELYHQINTTNKKINNNLFIYESGDLNPKHWI